MTDLSDLRGDIRELRSDVHSLDKKVTEHIAREEETIRKTVTKAIVSITAGVSGTLGLLFLAMQVYDRLR